MKNPPAIGDLIKAGYARLSENRRIDYEFVSCSKFLFKWIPIIINKAGFRDRERVPLKSRRTRRLICVGDSFTWGDGIVDISGTYPAILEKMINRVPNLDNRYEVLNMGIYGYNTIAEAALIEKEAFKWQADGVLLQFYDNDFELLDGQSNNNWAITRAVYKLRNGYIPTLRAGLKIFKKAICTHVLSCIRNKYFFAYPDSEFLDEGRDCLPDERAMDIARKCGFFVINVFRPLEEYPKRFRMMPSKVYRVSFWNNHPNVRENEILCVALLKGLVSRGEFFATSDRAKIIRFYGIKIKCNVEKKPIRSN